MFCAAVRVSKSLLIIGISSLFLLFCFLHTSAAMAKDPSKLVFIFQKQKQPDKLKTAAEEVARFLSLELGIAVETNIPSGYSASVQALVSKKADIAYTSSLPFLLARRDGNVELLLAEQRQDPRGNLRTDYDAIFVVKKDSQLSGIEELKKNSKNLRFAFTSRTSTSGYLFAIYRLIKEGIIKSPEELEENFKSISFAGSYTSALEQVLSGRADIAAVSYYTVEGKSAGKYLSEDQLAKLKVLSRTPGVPTHVLSARDGLSAPLKKNISKALQKLAKARPELLTDVYGTSNFVEVNEELHVANTVEAVKFLGLPIDNLVKK